MLGARLPGRLGARLDGALIAQSLSVGDDIGDDRPPLVAPYSELLEAEDMVRCFVPCGGTMVCFIPFLPVVSVARSFERDERVWPGCLSS